MLLDDNVSHGSLFILIRLSDTMAKQAWLDPDIGLIVYCVCDPVYVIPWSDPGKPLYHTPVSCSPNRRFIAAGLSMKRYKYRTMVNVIRMRILQWKQRTVTTTITRIQIYWFWTKNSPVLWLPPNTGSPQYRAVFLSPEKPGIGGFNCTPIICICNDHVIFVHPNARPKFWITGFTQMSDLSHFWFSSYVN